MAKFEAVENVKGMYQFYCPGCKCDHMVWTDKNENPCWEFNGDVDNPTVSPSLLVRYLYPGGVKICHSFIRNGEIQFLSDCTHELSGQTIKLQEI